MSVQTPPVTLREPAHQVAPKARLYWAVQSVLWWGAIAVAQVVTMIFFTDVQWWRWALLALTLVVLVIDAAVVPAYRYRVHRWEVTDTAVYTRTGWLNQELRIAPISRVQTIDSNQGPVMRMFGLSSVAVTTASAAGAITIEGLESRVAAELVEHLTVITEQTPDDAT